MLFLFCLLDEPTNHLDMESIDALAKGIKEFEGGVVTVSVQCFFVRCFFFVDFPYIYIYIGLDSHQPSCGGALGSG